MKFFIFFISFTIILSSCTNWDEQAKKEINPHKVTSQTIWKSWKDSFSVIWEVFSESETLLSAKYAWDIEWVYVKNWDRVRSWDVLLKLKSDSILTSYENAKTAYQNSIINLNRVIASTKAAVKSAQVAYENAKNVSLNTQAQVELQKIQAQSNLSSVTISTKLSIESAQQALDNLILTSMASEDLAQNNLNNAKSNSKVIIEDAINELDKILWIEEINKSYASTYKNYLWNLKQWALTNSQSAYTIAKQKIESCDYSNSQSILFTLEWLKNWALANLDLLKNSTTWPNFSDTDLQALIGSYDALSWVIQGAITSLSSAKKSLDSVRVSNLAWIESAKKSLALAVQDNWNMPQAITSAQSAYDSNVYSLNNLADNANNALTYSEAWLNSAKSSANLQINQAKSASDSAKWFMDSAKIQFDDLTIKAPFDWEITNSFVENWDEIRPWTNLLEIKFKWNEFKIVSYLTKNQLNWISVWDEVWIASKSKDYISSISSRADTSTKKYKVEIKHSNQFLDSGQFIDLHFYPKNELLTDDGKIFIPMTSVFITSDWNYVWLNSTWESLKRSVEIWEISWDKLEIISWLEIWDIVIVSWWRAIGKSWEKVEALMN